MSITPQFMIRNVERQDFQALYKLFGVVELKEHQPEKEIQEYVFEMAGGEGSDVLFVGVLKGEIIACCGYYKSYGDPFDVCWLNFFGVLPENQCSGFGQQIFDYTVRKIMELGYNRLLVWTSQTNMCRGAGKFYSRNGFTEFGRLKDFWREWGDKIYLEKDLERGA